MTSLKFRGARRIAPNVSARQVAAEGFPRRSACPRARAPKSAGASRAPIGEDGLQEAGDALGPGQRALRFADQILPDLDQRIGQSARSGDGVDRVAGQAAVIGFVVADVASGKIGLGEQSLDQRLRNPVVAIPQDPDLPRPGEAAPDIGERMDRDQGRRLAGRHHRFDRRIYLFAIRRPESRAAAGDLGGVDIGVAGHDGAVRVAHDQRRIMKAPIRVDDEARIGGEHGRRADERGKSAGCVGRADVIGDVTRRALRARGQACRSLKEWRSRRDRK